MKPKLLLPEAATVDWRFAFSQVRAMRYQYQRVMIWKNNICNTACDGVTRSRS